MRSQPVSPIRILLVALGAAAVAPAASGQVLNEGLKLLASDGGGGDQFGTSIAIGQGVVAVGAPYTDDNSTNSGSAYLYDAATGAELIKLVPDDNAGGDNFGISIAIGGGRVAVGAYTNNTTVGGSGSVYLFDAATGAELNNIIPSDGEGGDGFGRSVAIDGGLIAIGAYRDDDNGVNAGSAYVFDPSSGSQIKLLPDDGDERDEFGSSIAIDGGVVVVGSRLDDDNGTDSGSAYLFDATTGAQLLKLMPTDGSAVDQFGWSVAIEDGIVAVGARRDDDNGTNSGSAYLFDAATGAQLLKILPDDGASEDHFGSAVSMADGRFVVTARFDDDNGPTSGSAYIFDTATGAQLSKLLASDGASGDEFGTCIAIDHWRVAVGARADSDNGNVSGSAYVFDACPADVNHDGVLTPADFTAWIAAFNAMTPECDQNGDGLCTPGDFTAWIANFNAGC